MRFFRKLFSGKLWNWVSGGAGSIIAILLFAKNVFNFNVLQSVLIGIGIVLLLLLIRLSYLFMRDYHAKSVYGDAIVQLKDAFGEVNKLKRSSTNDTTQIMKTMLAVCDNLKIVFDKKTGAECSASIKVPLIGPVSGCNQLTNLCRDSKHALIRDTDEYKKIQHTVVGNTAFQVVLNNVLDGDKSRFAYVNNNIHKTNNYLNTSKKAHPGGVLPYKSELVYPIVPLVPCHNGVNKDSENTKEKYEIWGFVCVDCNSTNSFDDKYDVAIIAGIADGVYDVIMKIKTS